MATIKRNSLNNDYTNNADGFDIAGGTTVRKLTVTGGDIIADASGSGVKTFPPGTVTLISTEDLHSVAFAAMGGVI